MNSGHRPIPLIWLAMRLWHRIYTDIVCGHRGLICFNWFFKIQILAT